MPKKSSEGVVKTKPLDEEGVVKTKPFDEEASANDMWNAMAHGDKWEVHCAKEAYMRCKPREDAADRICKLIEEREEFVAAPVIEFRPQVKVLYFGPFAVDYVVQKLSQKWKTELEEYSMTANIVVADPPFHMDDVECRGYWLKPEGKDFEKRVKSLRKQLATALIWLMQEIEKHRPRVVIGEGQGGVVVGMSSFPIILERACRDRAVTQLQMVTYRQAWSGVAALFIVDPVMLPSPITHSQRP